MFRIFAALIIFTSFVFGEVVQLPLMKQVKEKVLSLLNEYKSEDILVIFDIDMVITLYDHPAFYMPNMKAHKKAIKEVLSDKRLTPLHKDLILNLIVQEEKAKLVEDDTQSILNAIKDKNIKIMALTAAMAGNINNIVMEEFRYKTLKSMGIDFSKAFSSLERIEFKNLLANSFGHPLFYKGILFSNGESSFEDSKGLALVAFIKNLLEQKIISHKPKVIVFVDDKRANIDSVKKHMTAYDSSIKVIGIEYLAGYNYAPKTISEEDIRKKWEYYKGKSLQVLPPSHHPQLRLGG